VLKQRAIAVAVLVLMTALVGERRGASSPCEAAYRRGGDFMASLAVCEREFATTGSGSAGLNAARSANRLGRHEDVLAWATRMTGKAEEPKALELAARSHFDRQHDESAKELYRRAVEGFRSTGDARSAARCLYTLYVLGWRNGDHRDAFLSAAQAYQEAATAHDRQMELYALRGLVSALYEIGDRDAAAHALQKTDELTAADDRAAQAWSTMQHGLLHLSELRYAAALASFEQSLTLLDPGDVELVVPAHLNATEASLLLGDVEQAQTHLRAARTAAGTTSLEMNRRAALAFYESWIAEARGRFPESARIAAAALGQDVIAEWRWQLEFRLGRAEEGAGRLATAESAYTRAVGDLEQLRVRVSNDEFKDWLIERRRRPFEALFQLRVLRRDYAGALRAVEQAKARVLYDAFVQSAAQTSVHLDSLSAASEAARNRFDALRSFMPSPGASTVAILPSVPELLHAVGDRRVVVYFVSGDDLWALLVADGRISARRAGPARHVRDVAERLAARPDDLDLAATVAPMLLPEGWLPPRNSTLYIVPDGALRDLPFAALRYRGHWLVERLTISYVPSVSTLALLTQVSRDRNGPDVILGDPSGDLPAARRESEWVAGHLRTAAHVGAAATLQRLAGASGARLLHVAAHSWLAPGGPWLRLADGDVSASVIVRDRIGPEIAVLASCSGAAARGTNYWGSWSAAFLIAGTRSVVASVWSVQDADSRYFIQRFYESGGSEDPAGGLALAQRRLIVEGRSPSSWAPFVHIGLRRNKS